MKSLIRKISTTLLVLGLLVRIGKYLSRRSPQISSLTNENKVRKMLTPAQLERRNKLNALDGFPTNARIES